MSLIVAAVFAGAAWYVFRRGKIEQREAKMPTPKMRPFEGDPTPEAYQNEAFRGLTAAEYKRVIEDGQIQVRDRDRKHLGVYVNNFPKRKDVPQE